MNEDRLWSVLSEIRVDIKDLCIRTSVIEANLENHLEHQRTKFNKMTILLSVSIAGLAVYLSYISI